MKNPQYGVRRDGEMLNGYFFELSSVKNLDLDEPELHEIHFDLDGDDPCPVCKDTRRSRVKNVESRYDDFDSDLRELPLIIPTTMPMVVGQATFHDRMFREGSGRTKRLQSTCSSSKHRK
jgi:hypothetical protein